MSQQTEATVTACPDCDSSDLVHRVNSARADPTDGKRYRCRDCGLTFDEGAERASQSGRASPGDTLASKLADTPPGDVRGDR